MAVQDVDMEAITVSPGKKERKCVTDFNLILAITEAFALLSNFIVFP